MRHLPAHYAGPRSDADAPTRNSPALHKTVHSFMQSAGWFSRREQALIISEQIPQDFTGRVPVHNSVGEFISQSGTGGSAMHR